MVAELGDMVGMRTKPKVAKSITELIGNTPLLQLDRSVAGLDATVLAKLEECDAIDDCITEAQHIVEEAWAWINPSQDRSFNRSNDRLFDQYVVNTLKQKALKRNSDVTFSKCRFGLVQ